MDEFDGLIEKICNASSPAPVRAAAELRLMEILSNAASWKPYANLLFQASDTVCFFICIGFQRMAWRHWRTISMEDRLMLNQTIVQTLTTRPNMQTFAKSKLEQVLATICANSCSLEPALGLLVDANHPNVNTGLSAMRTVLELILSEDPQLFPEHRAPLNSAVNDIVLPLTNLACSACNAAINGTSEAKEQNSHTVTVSLDLLKVLISKLQIGPHVTTDVIDLLFSVAELGASGAQCNINAEDLRRAALSSIEILTEIMSKRYLPPISRVNTDTGTCTGTGSGSGNTGSTSSGSLNFLTDIVVKTVSLLKKIRMSGNIGESAVAVSLLEFVSVFSESHLERCISLSTMQTSSTSASIGSGGNTGTGNVDNNMNTTVLMFFEELVAITTCTMEPEILSKIVCVWNRVIALGSVKDTLLLQTPLCLSIVSHLLQSCLLQTNVYLADSSDELVEDLAVDTLVDPHIRNVLSHICDYGTNAVEGAEEVNYVGSVLLADTATLFGEMVSSSDVQQWLSNSVSQLVVQDIPRLSSSDTVAVDLHFLVRLLPLVSANVMQLVSQLCGLLGQLVDSQMHTRGRQYVALELVCCQLVGQLLQSGRAVPIISAVTADTIANMQNVFALLIAAATRVCNDVPLSNSVSVVPVATAVSALLLQAVNVYVDILELDNSQCASLRQCIVDTLQAIMVHVPIEVVTLHVCAQDLLQPHGVAQLMVAQCVELVGVVEQSAGTNYASLDGQTIERLTKMTAALDGLARNHSLSKPQRRQLLVSYYTPLQQFMGKFASVMFRLLLHTYSTEYAQHNGGGNSGTSTSSSGGNGSSAGNSGGVNSSAVCYEVRLVVSLSCALLQSLGKKSFGKAAADVLNISVDFAENINAIQLPANSANGNGGGSLSKLFFERSGLQLTKQLLELSQVLAESTAAASPSVNNQASSTHRLLCFVAVGLSDDRICAELLQPTLKAGITAVRCYWQKTQRSLPFLASINQNQGQQEQMIMHSPNGGAAYPDINGENVRPIAVLLTQLCVGSLSPNVPPQDTLTALEGLIMLSEQHKLFAMNWFQNQCFGSLLTPVLKAVLLRIHNNHRPTLESLLIALASAGESSYLAMAQSELNNQQHQQHQVGSPSLQRGTSGSGSDSPHGARNVGEAMYAKYQEFWVTIGSEMIGIAAQYRCGEMASHTLYSVLNSYQAAAVAAGQYSAGISSISANSSSRGPFLVDMRIFIDKIINPVSSEIARLN